MDNQNKLNRPEDFLEVFRIASDHVSEGVLPDLIKLGKEAVLPLMVALKDESESVKYYSILALDGIGDTKASTALYNSLDDDDSDTREAAAYALIHMNATSMFNFVKTLSDDSWRMRSSAAFILGKIQSEEAVETLCSNLNDTCGKVRAMVAYALGEIANPTTTAALLKALEDNDELVRVNTIEALGNIGNEKILDALQKLEKLETSENVRKTLRSVMSRI